MALSASAIFQIQSTATSGNVNAGYFNPANANMATDLTTDANTANTSAPVVSSASYNFVAGDVGHWLYIKSGTNWTPGWYKIASVASNKATLSAAVGSASVVQVNANNLYGTNTVIGCATVGTPTSGTWTIDYSQSDTSPFSSTDLASTIGTTNPSTITSAANPFGVNMVGNGLHVTAGTNWTSQWCEIVSVSGTTATIDKAAGSAASLSSGTGKVGGALSLGSGTATRTDNDVFGLAVASSTASGRYFIKGSVTYTLGATVTAAAGNAAWPVIMEGYATSRGDRPTGTTRPTFDCGTATFTHGANTMMFSVIGVSVVAAAVFQMASTNYYESVKATNKSTSSSAIGIATSSNGFFYKCEGIAYRGIGIDLANAGAMADCCYAHDSDTGIRMNVNANSVINCIAACNTTQAINNPTNMTGPAMITNCTLYGGENKTGIGLKVASGSRTIFFKNNIVYGFATGVSMATTQTANVDDYNNYFNNTADVSAAGQWPKGAHDTAVNPSFASVTQRTGSTATTTAGNHLVQAGATFQTWGVAAGDYLYIVSGTGVTVGVYGILSVDSETQITADITLTANATSDKVWQITTGRNFAIGAGLKGFGYPGAMPGGLSTGYMDQGAVQAVSPNYDVISAGSNAIIGV